MRYNLVFSFLLISVILSPYHKSGAEKKSPYKPLDAKIYLTGKFNPAKHPAFLRLDSLGIRARKDHWLRREAALALLRLQNGYKKAYPHLPFRIVSATRNFFSQKRIWERKWSGRQRVAGNILTKTHPNQPGRALVILRYSSMPGTSRHHWGTDIDINSLNNKYFEKGNGAILFKWLQKNAHKYGFCRPYTPNRREGYQEEKWHWSYKPLAHRFLNDWLHFFETRHSLLKGFMGSKFISHLAPIYVKSINPDCK